MNIKRILKSTAKILLVEALLLISPIIIALIYKEPLHNILAFIYTILILLSFSLPILLITRKEISGIFSSEGFVIVTISWILLSLFGGLPLLFTGQYNSLVDTFFETSSGFTTTGASVISDVSHLSQSIIFWKALIQAIGGMGVLVFALAILPNANKEDIHLMRAEVPGPIFGKIVSKIGDTAKVLYKIYFVLIITLITALMLAGMNLFDAIVHAFETAGTGGFSIYNGSIAYYDSIAIEIILAVGMIVFSINFTIYHLIIIKKFNEAAKNEEIKWFFVIILLAVIAITINLTTTKVFDLFTSLRHAFFTVSSTITTTGFSSTDFGNWPLFSQLTILLTMIIGGTAGSTAGGIKVSRLGAAIKSAISEIKKSKNPKRILKVRFDGKVLNDSYIKSLGAYFILYALIFIFLLLCVSIDLKDFMSAFSAVAATFNNVGPGLAEVGPASSFGMLSDFNKILLSFGMIAGRLEIIPMLILFMPETWKRT